MDNFQTSFDKMIYITIVSIYNNKRDNIKKLNKNIYERFNF
jgi:endonuclease III